MKDNKKDKRKKQVVINIDGNLYLYSSLKEAAKRLGKEYHAVEKWIKHPNNKYSMFNIKVEYYNEEVHKNIKESF